MGIFCEDFLEIMILSMMKTPLTPLYKKEGESCSFCLKVNVPLFNIKRG